MMPTSVRFTVRLVILLSLLAGTAWAAPFSRDFSFRQPDGTEIMLHGQGDEFYAFFEDTNGYAVTFNQKTKAYHYVNLSIDGSTLEPVGLSVGKVDPVKLGLAKHVRISAAARKKQVAERYQEWDKVTGNSQRWSELKAKNLSADGSGTTTKSGSAVPRTAISTGVGNMVGLTILVDFSDAPATIPQTNLVDFCNGTNYTGYGNNGSVRQYYADVSGGLLTYTNVVTVYIRVPQPKSYYNTLAPNNAGTQGRLLATDAVNAMKALTNYATDILPQFSALTVDGSSHVLACNVLFAGASSGAWSQGLWPNAWSLSSPIDLGNGKQVYRYQITDIGTAPSISTCCHEDGHMLFGYPDLYSYSYSCGGAGKFCLMSYGATIDYNPPQIDGYLKYKSGWGTVININSNTYLPQASLSATGALFNTYYRYQKPGVSTEYYLIENRQKSGRDANMPGGGLLIWHVDEAVSGGDQNPSTNYNTSHANFELTLMQADNLWQLENTNTTYYGDANDPYYSGNSAAGYTNAFSDVTGPCAFWWDGTPSGLKLSKFSTKTNAMTFQIGALSVNLVPAGTALVAESFSPANGAVDPNETVTVQFALQNTGNNSTANLVATLVTNSAIVPLIGTQTYGVVTNGGAAVSRPFTFAANGNCGDSVPAVLQLQDGTNNYGYVTNFLTLGAPTGIPVTNNYSSGGVAVAIPDNGQASLPIVVPNAGTISNVAVRVRLNHTYDSDLVISLIHPDGTTVLLANKRGSSGHNYGSGNTDCTGTFTIFSDAAGTAISAGAAPFAGSYRPESPLAALNGKPFAGTWYLQVQDTAAQDTGTVYCVQLDLTAPTYVCNTGSLNYQAALLNLTASVGTLNPAFAFNLYSYTSSVPYGISNLTVTPTAVNTNATISVNGSPVVSGNPSSALNLNVGTNLISTVVVSPDTTMTNTYTLIVTRSAGSTNAYLTNWLASAGTLNPLFVSNTFSYTDSVAYTITNLTVTPTAADTNATITVNGSPVISGNASTNFNLLVGTNLITAVVVCENGTVSNTYSLTVTRDAGSTNAYLTNLVASAGTLSPIFASNILSYTASVPYTATNLTVTPTAADTNATITVNGNPVISGSASTNLNLLVGTNLITTVVISQNATVTNIYSLTVTRDVGSSNAYLANLVSSAAPLDPVFATNFFNYTNSVPFATGSLTVTPTAADTNATITVNGNPVISGSASTNLNLNVGTNIITTSVISQNATMTNTYFLTVTRAPSVSRWWDGGATDILTNGNGISAGGGGTWDATITNWDQGNGQIHLPWNNTNANIAVFGGAAGTVTNTVDITVGGLTFTNAYTITNVPGTSLFFNAAGTISNNAAVTIATPLAGTGPITKTGSGTLTFNAANNSYSGGTVLNAGTLVVTADNQLGTTSGGVTFAGSATLNLNTATAWSLDAGRTVTFSNGAVATFSSGNGAKTIPGKVTGAGSLVFGSTTSLTLSNANNDFTGAITSSTGGTTTYGLELASISDVAGVGAINLGTGGTFRWIGYSGSTKTLTNRQFVLTGGATTVVISALGATANDNLVIKKDLLVTATGAKNLTLAGVNTGKNTFAGNISDSVSPAAVISIVKSEAGTWILGGTNTYTGATTCNTGSGTLIFQGTSAAPSGGTITLNQISSGTSAVKLLADGIGTNTFPTTVAFDQRNTTTGIGFTVGNTGAGNGGTGGGTTTGATIAVNKFSFIANQGGVGGVDGPAVIGINNGYTLQIGAVSFAAVANISANWPCQLVPSGGSINVIGTVQQNNGNTSTAKNVIFKLDGTSANNSITGNILDAADYTSGSNVNAMPLAVTKTSSSVWTLAGNNNFSGGLTLNGATAGSQLNINSATALGTGTFTINGGNNAKFDNTSGTNLTLTANNPQAWSSDFAFVGSTNLNLGTGAVTMGGTRNITVTANTLTVGGGVSGSTFGIAKLGNGTLVLNGTNTYTGPTAVSFGTLLMNSDSSAATNTVNVAAFGIFGGTGIVGGVVICTNGGKLLFTLTPTATTYSNSTYMTFTNAVFLTNVTVKVDMPTNLGNGTYVLATNYVSWATNGSLTFATNSGSLGTNGSGSVSVSGNNLILKVSGVSGGQTASTWSYSNTGPFAYDGTAKTPTINFSGSTGTKTTNYVGTGTTTYASVNAPTNAGTYYVSNTVVADSNYFGATNSQGFTIKAPGNFSGISVSGTGLTLNVTNGTPGGTWTLLESTNMLLPVAQWRTNRTGIYDGSGNLTTNIVNAATNPAQFYLLK